MKTMNEYWSMNEGAFSCLHDKKRTTAFRKAIRNSVQKGNVVVELGAGTGVLSMFAVDAGAKKVYAVELDKRNIETLHATIKKNGYAGKIEVIQGDATKVVLPEQVDFIICEMIATGLIEELQVPANNHALKFLKKDGSVLLSEYQIYADLVFSKSNFYNKVFDVIRFELPEMRDMKPFIFSKKSLIKSINFKKRVTSEKLKECVLIPVTKTGIINAVRISGKTIFSDNTTFENSTSYDFPMILPITETNVKIGECIVLNVSYNLCQGPEYLRYSVTKK